MCRPLLIVLALCVAVAALAATAPTGNHLSTEGKGRSMGDGAMSPRVGGEAIGSAVLIPSLPFSDIGATCGYVNDYDEMCTSGSSASPDVVYSYTPAADEAVTIDLCASSYDTKVYVYAGGMGNLVACNDDAGCGYSGFQSMVSNVLMTADLTYYIVIDGYGGACGTYDLQVAVDLPCDIECERWRAEGETRCHLDYEDDYNGGCNWIPTKFQPLDAESDNHVVMCGESGTYTFWGQSYRDTDWFESYGVGQTVVMECRAYFPVQLLFIWGADCNNLQFDSVTGNPCPQVVHLERQIALDAKFWTWVGPSVFTGVPCGRRYRLELWGIRDRRAVPVESVTWGHIKDIYR